MSQYVLVTTEYRGVFAGELEGESKKRDRVIELKNVRNIIYWAGSNGFLGLAASGPDKGSKLGSTADRIILHGVTSVTDCTDAAAKAIAGWTND